VISTARKIFVREKPSTQMAEDENQLQWTLKSVISITALTRTWRPAKLCGLLNCTSYSWKPLRS